MSEPTPRKPSKRPAVSMIGSPAIEIQRAPRGVPNSISSALNGCFSSSTRAEFGMPAEKRGKRVADELACRPAEHRAHARADVGHAVVAIDLPQPADAALLIFLEQEAGALALAADVGVGLELMKGPARDGHDAGDRDAEREKDRQHVLEGNGVAGKQKRPADAASKGDHPGHRALRDDDEAEAADAKAGHDRGGDDLACRDRASEKSRAGG